MRDEMITAETKPPKDFYVCRHGHICCGEEIPEYGLDIYCTACLREHKHEPLDLLEDPS